MRLAFALAVVVALAVGSAASAATYHVAAKVPGASDDNPGTQAQPWRTLVKAAASVRPGDTVLVHEGRYAESVRIAVPGTAQAPITFAAFGDDAVVLDGADERSPDQWTPVEGLQKVFATPLERDPGHIFVDGKPVYMKLDQVEKFSWRLGTLTDDDERLWQFDRENGRLLLNLGEGNPAVGHRIEVPTRALGFELNTHCRLRGLYVTRFTSVGIEMGEDSVAEDCLVTDCGNGIRVAGWHRRGAVIRRNTVLGCLVNGIFLQDRPTVCRVEENLVMRCSLNPWHEVLWAGSVKMNSASDTVFAHNVVLEAGNPNTINGWDGWALWGDINVLRIAYLGNTCAYNEEAGIYVEFAMDDTRAYFNTSYKDGHGITCRASQRGVFMHNYVQSARSSGLAVWDASEPFRTVDNVFAHNLVRDCWPSLRLQVEHPQLCDYNAYWPPEGAPLADGEKGHVYATLSNLREGTGHEMHGEARDAQPADVGLDLVTFCLPDAPDPDQPLMMIGNGGFEYDDPTGINLLPYFWRAGTGDGVERTFLYPPYTGLGGDCESFAYPGGGATVSLRADTQEAKVVHSGRRCLQVAGVQPNSMPVDGTGVWSPVFPARPGDTFRIGFWVRGQDLEPIEGRALAAFAEFSGRTGQHRTRVDLATAFPVGLGTFDWREVTTAARVPETARRVTLFLGLRPARGSLWLDDVSLGVQ